MPAVELLKLRSQLRGLSDLFGTPDIFVNALKDFLELNSNRSYRPGAAVKPQPLLPSYRVTPLIFRGLELEISRMAQVQPMTALQVAEALWLDTHLETHQIASIILGSIPYEYGQDVIQKIRDWSRPEENFHILDILYQKSTTTLRQKNSPLPLELAEEWIATGLPKYQTMALRLLIPIIQDDLFENLPPIFRMLSPILQTFPTVLQADLQAIIEALILRSPAETAFFLRQFLTMASGQNTARLIRRCLPLFEPEQQSVLKAALRAV